MKNLVLRFSLLITFLLLSVQFFAQTGIKGVVTDSYGEPSAEVFFGLPRTFNVGLMFTF